VVVAQGSLFLPTGALEIIRGQSHRADLSVVVVVHEMQKCTDQIKSTFKITPCPVIVQLRGEYV
jgi:hypothetical protein